MTPVRTPAGRHLAATVAQYIHELSGRHAAVRRAARPDRTPVRESAGA